MASVRETLPSYQSKPMFADPVSLFVKTNPGFQGILKSLLMTVILQRRHGEFLFQIRNYPRIM